MSRRRERILRDARRHLAGALARVASQRRSPSGAYVGVHADELRALRDALDTARRLLEVTCTDRQLQDLDIHARAWRDVHQEQVGVDKPTTARDVLFHARHHLRDLVEVLGAPGGSPVELRALRRVRERVREAAWWAHQGLYEIREDPP